MARRSRTGCFAAVAALVLSAALLPARAPAQGEVAGDEPDDSGDVIDVVRITGQRGEDDTRAQAIAISSFAQGELDQLGVSDFGDLQRNVPSLQIGRNGTNGVVTIRGVGVSNLSLNGDQSVLVVLDGVPLGRPSAALQPFFDVRAVRALRGPQGWGGGKHVTGGLLEIESMPPEPAFTAFGDYQLGSYDQHVWRAYLNLPVVGEQLMLRFSSRFEDRDGFQRRGAPRFEGFFPVPFGEFDDSDALDDAHDLLFRGQARSVIRDGLELRLIGQYSSQQGNGPTRHLIGKPNVSTTLGCEVNLQCDRRGPRFANTPTDPRVSLSDFPGHRDDRQVFATGILTWDTGTLWFGDVRTSFQAGYNRDEFDQSYDSDLTNASATVVFETGRAEQYSAEFAVETVDARPFDWRIGAFWWQEEAASDAFVDANGSRRGGNERAVNEVDTRTISGFFELDYWPTDRVRVGVGLNYSEDHKEVLTERGRSRAGRLFGTVADDAVFSGPSWKLLFDWRVTDESWLGISVSSGFKAGGFPVGLNCAGEIDCDPYGAEEVIQYELTSRNTAFDERLRLDLTLFWTEYQPYQVCLRVGIGFNCASKGEATTRGVEVELGLYPVPELAIIGNFNLLDARIDNHRIADPVEVRFPIPGSSFENPLNGFPQDLSGNRLERAPRYNLSVLARYDVRLGLLGLPGWGTLTPQIQYQYQSRTYFRVFNIQANSQPRYSLVNFRTTWRSESGRWSLEGFVDNVGDVDVVTFMTVGAGPEIQATYNRPRWAGLRLGFHY